MDELPPSDNVVLEESPNPRSFPNGNDLSEGGKRDEDLPSGHGHAHKEIIGMPYLLREKEPPQEELNLNLMDLKLDLDTPPLDNSGEAWDNLNELLFTLPNRETVKNPNPKSNSSSGPNPKLNHNPNPSSSPEKRGGLRIYHVGGSLTFLLQIAVLAWGIRQLRSVLAKRRQKQAPRINTAPFRLPDSPPLVTLSALAAKRLAETDPATHILIDVRFPEAAAADPFVLGNTVNIPEGELKIYLQLSDSEWESCFPLVHCPSKAHLLIFLSTKGRRAQRAAITAAELGFNGCCVVSGGIQGFYATCRNIEQYQPRLMSRDAVALLLQKENENRSMNQSKSTSMYLIDVRRHDERILYGHIHGSLHVPVNEWPKAIAMEESDWEKNYHCKKFGQDDLIIVYGRANNRSSWAAQIACEAGFTRCCVCNGGILGWRLDATVLPYDAYSLGDPPPESHQFDVEALNEDNGRKELQQLGIHLKK